uniref:Uncharacterized protein LOC105129896 n=1 Tax=Rhizophora mucronata TaxID=61149 RepID=A0A2P2KAJ7_RHIMU
MSRSSQHREKYRLASVISRVDDDEGTAARTRPYSFDEIMSRRKNRKLPVNEKEGFFEETPGNVVVGKISNISAPERGSGQSKDSSHSAQKHLSKGNMKASSRKKEEKAYLNDGHLVKHKDKETRDSKNKLRGHDEDLRTNAKGRIEERVHGRRMNNERPSNYYRDEAAKKHSRDLESDRHMGRNREKSERESKRKYPDGDDKKSRDMNTMKKNDLGKGHDLEISERKKGKESSKSHFEETRLKRRRSRSREHEDKNRRSISLSPKAYKRGSYRGKDYVDVSSHFSKGMSGRQHSDIDRSKGMFNGSGSQYRRHSGSTSGLGGYSPRKRRTEAAVKIPSPMKRSPEKRSAKWDIAPEGKHSTFPASIPSDFLSLNKITSSVIGELVSAAPVRSTTLKSPSEILASALSTSKNASIDSIQLTQATRPMRRLYMDNLPASSSEKAVVEVLNNFLISSGANHIQGTQPCINCIINKEKGQALVEFLTPEDASAALSFDGSMFLGSIIKIRRPKDFVEVAVRILIHLLFS